MLKTPKNTFFLSFLMLQALAYAQPENILKAPQIGSTSQDFSHKISNVDYQGTIVQEKVPFQRQLDFFNSPKGKLFGLWAQSRTASKLMGWAQNGRNPFTMNWKKFVEKYQINLEECIIPEGGYATFNEFFTRKLKPGARKADATLGGIVSPADSKCTFVQDISKKDIFIIKSSKWSLARMLMNRLLAELYDGGTLISFRLAPEDYHRFHFPCDCTPGFSKKIVGKYNSVNPYVFKLGQDPLGENARNILVLKSIEFSDPLCIIVGAMGVGKIVETYIPEMPYKKADEMGYFKFGASTICLLFRKGVIQAADEKFITNSQQMIETAVKQGQLIAVKMLPAITATVETSFFSFSTITNFVSSATNFYAKTSALFTDFFRE